MLSRTYLKTSRWAPLASANPRSSLHQITPVSFPTSTRLFASSSSKPGETVGGTKTDHTKEFDQPSQSQKSGEQHTQQPGDTVKKGGSQGAGTSSGTKTSGSKAGGAGDSQQESGQHVGPMGSG
ncbi:hypothetical protein G7054_g3615 [Neopestalotiopsis clavispora]|nr:hypothetical protein G7054_g3615 [Neopestalotiopsis clavispora]